MVLQSLNKVETLILDAGPIIKLGTKVKDYANQFITVPEVIREVRDRQARQQLAIFPFEIQVRVPSEEAFKAVVAFSKLTGDYAALSSVDLKVLALTYMVEKEKCGIEHLRTEPVKAQVQVGAAQQRSLPKQGSPKGGKVEAKLTKDQPKVTSTNLIEKEASKLKKPTNPSEVAIVQNLEKLSLSKAENTSSEESDPTEHEESDDSDGEWITPQNLKLKQMESLGQLKKGDEVKVRKVGCITTDYAMQSVILQMNLALVSVEGLMIKHLNSYVMRCHACFKVTTNLTKQFCPSCGGPTLIRTSCSVGEDGVVKYYLKKNFRYNLRGIRYSIPTPKGGHINTDLILCEDTKEYQRALKNYLHRKEANLFDPDYLPGILTGKHAKGSHPPIIGYGRRNPNEVDRFKGRKKA